MAVVPPVDHGGTNAVINDQPKPSYSERLKSNVKFDQRLKRNVLEVTIEKLDTELTMVIGNEDVARICQTLGIEISSQVEGYNIHYYGRKSILCVWMAAGLNLERFCKDISIRVGEGLVTGLIRPAGKRDVTVTISGLDFNTPDSFVFEYLKKFGHVSSEKVVYSKFEAGPFIGKYNGERKYQVDFSQAKLQMGNYHIIDGHKVRVFYRGNGKTCARCHGSARKCPGGGLAKSCGEAGGIKVPLAEHMKNLWSQVGFTPTSFEPDEMELVEDEDHQAEIDSHLQNLNFSPKIVQQPPSDHDMSRFDGISIKNIPAQIEDKDIFEFLCHAGMPSSIDQQNLRINRGDKKTWVFINCIENDAVQDIYTYIYFNESKNMFFDVPLFCRRFRNSSPLKQQASSVEQVSLDSVPAVNSDIVESPSQQLIPGLPEKDRLLAKRKSKKKKKQRLDNTQCSSLIQGKKYFFKSLNVNEDSSNLEQFQFSDYADSENVSSEEDENFEDSKEILSDSDLVNETSTPATTLKRVLTSPVNDNFKKKPRESTRKK